MEILSPAGSPEALAAAVKGGCDAVYLGGKSFGARAFASNFTDEELEGAVRYAHRHKVKVNVTVNTIIKNSEMSEAISFVRFLKDIGADAVIVQDLGLLRNIRDIGIPIHASTQMGIHSKAGLRWCAENGISRAILSRELTLDEIRSVTEDSPIETEVFVQGAMCYCMSGGCLFSSIVGGRSGNRGECAQPCRKKYISADGNGYCLSNADLFCIDHLKELGKMGITSVKIEGRMRSPAYTYLATKAYSDANKGDVPDTMLLKTIFNRGFCKGYMDGAKDLVQSKYPDNRGLFIGTVDVKDRRIDIGNLGLNKNDGISLFSEDMKVGGFKLTSTDSTVAPFKLADGRYDLYRTYDPRLDEVKNLIGRAPKLEGKKGRSRQTERVAPRIERTLSKPKLSFYVSSMKILEAVLPYADRIYYDGPDFEDAAALCGNKEIVRFLPRFDPEGEKVHEGYPVMAHNPGQIAEFADRPVYASYTMNMFNSYFTDVPVQSTLSVELTKSEIRDVVTRWDRPVEVMVFGRIELMYTRDPNLKSGTIKDEKGYAFPVYRDYRGYAHILNSSDLMLFDFVGDLERMGVDSLGIDVRKRPADLAALVGKTFRNKDPRDMEKIRQMCGGTFNTGHYLRGV